jgi:alpha-glucosidase
MVKDSKFIWWKHGIIYHIYPRSFKDTNKDGIGDLNGITEKLPYLKDLGIDAIWLSPIYKSPFIDAGYDIADYKTVDEDYGDLSDFRTMLNDAHNLGIKVIMDMVMNHTSNHHPWFIESASSLNNSKRDWYIWKKNKKSKAPNNWRSVFGGSAWELDKQTNSYYLHTFFKEQPDLNWRNKAMRRAFFMEIEYWLDLGVDGFRLDVINMLGKDKKFRNNPPLFKYFLGKPKTFSRNRRRSYKIVQRLRKLMDQYDSKVLIGEIYNPPPGDSKLVASYLGNGKDSLNMAFDFTIFFKKWDAKKYFNSISNLYNEIPFKAWPCFVLSNHDLSRSINRFGKNKEEKAKLAAILQMTLRGTPFIYYGEEIGMTNVKLKKAELIDPLGKRFWPVYLGRDRSRTPMQWNNSINAGFSFKNPGYQLTRIIIQLMLKCKWKTLHPFIIIINH